MGEMLKELGSLDEENYVYLDKDGQVQKRVDLTFHWDPLPQTRILHDL